MALRVTMRAVAKAAGVSATTVSLALRDDRRIAAATRERIRRLAQDMGYERDPTLSALVSLRDDESRRLHRRPLGLAIVPGHMGNAHRLNRLLREGVDRAAGDSGHFLDAFELPESVPAATAILQDARGRGLRGLILLTQVPKDTYLPYDFGNLTVVSLGYPPRPLLLDTVAPHDFHAVELAWRELRWRGYRRIAFALHPHTDSNSDHQWSAAYRHCCASDEDCDRLPIYDEASPYPGARGWIAEHRPEVMLLIKNPDHGLAAALDAFRQSVDVVRLGLKEPTGPTAGVVHDFTALGASAVMLLEMRLRERLVGRVPACLTMLTEGRWYDAPSIRPPL